MWSYNYNTKALGDDELMHFKYLKRYKVHGKWRYVYGDRSVHDVIKYYNDKSDSNLREAQKHYEQAANERDTTKYSHTKFLENDGKEGKYGIAQQSKFYFNFSMKEAEKQADIGKEFLRKSNEASEVAKKFVDDYDFQKMVKNKVDHGKQFVSDLLNRFKKRRN